MMDQDESVYDETACRRDRCKQFNQILKKISRIIGFGLSEHFEVSSTYFD
jgi:hypothetical protein